MERWQKVLTAGAIFWACPGFAQEPCAVGTLFEPYSQVCAPINDVRDQFVPQAATLSSSQFSAKTANTLDRSFSNSRALIDAASVDLPIPGRIAVGTTYRELPTQNSGRLHTKMFVHPDGLQPDAALPHFLYTTATSHIQRGLEILVVYSPSNPNGGRLWNFAWTCLPAYPCPGGETSGGWMWFRELSSLTCNITHGVDQGGHAQKLLYYANHTDKLDDGTPPLWKSAVYLWNYCDNVWDLAWEHTYRVDKIDCSVPGSGCAWWGPGLEIFGTAPYPQIAELGYEDSLLRHDGVWSELRWPEAGFRDPAMWAGTAPAIPWQLFHLDPNRGYGVGNWLDINDPPTIDAQQPLQMLEDETLTLSADSLVINDPDIDAAYHAAFALTLHGGANYSRDELSVAPDADYFGTLIVPVTVSDGAADSPTFDLEIEVTPINDPPVITGQSAVQTRERTPVTINLSDVTVRDPDNAASELAITVLDGADFQRSGNTITPILGATGQILIPVTVSDAETTSAPFDLVATVTLDTVAPVITLLGNSTVSLFVGDRFQDSGATASDDLDGDITARITISGNVDTATSGSYTVTYSVSDLAGNAAAAALRTVTVQIRPTSSGGSGGSCFIATAAYGSYLDSHVAALRDFRDRKLMQHGWGRWFIQYYYRHSPPIAKLIERSATLRVITRGVLTPVVYGVLYPRTALVLVLVSLMVLMSALRRLRANRSSICGGRITADIAGPVQGPRGSEGW